MAEREDRLETLRNELSRAKAALWLVRKQYDEWWDLSTIPDDVLRAEVARRENPIHIHVNKTGRICLSKEVHEIIGDSGYCTVTADATCINLSFQEYYTEGALRVRMGNGRPFISDTRTLQQFGFDGSFSLNPRVSRVGDMSFTLAMADAVAAKVRQQQ